VSAVCARIKERVPEVDVYEKHNYSLMCMQYWLTRTGIGLSFGIAALLGLLVGLAIVAQTLYASVIERIKEFGTLKAMGADDGCIARFIVAQAVGNAVFGSLIGLAGTLLAAGLMDTPRTRVVLTWSVAALSVALISVVCLVAAWFPYWRIRKIDPASVLRS
jgi:putative ABC transport system permease protein